MKEVVSYEETLVSTREWASDEARSKHFVSLEISISQSQKYAYGDVGNKYPRGKE